MKSKLSRARNRRGMMLLLMILMLSLFMAIGAVLLTIALRSRTAARAFAQASLATSFSDNLVRDALDQALMAVIRGANSGTNGSVTLTGTSSSPVLENLLADKYGNSGTTTGNTLSAASGPLITINITSVPSWNVAPDAASRLNGRVLTIQPDPADGDTTSFRILGAIPNGGGATCYLANMPSTKAKRLPPASKSYPVVINGREFMPVSGTNTPEAYDSFRENGRNNGAADLDTDLYLAQPVLSNTCQVIGYSYLSFVGPSGTTSAVDAPEVDNDNDGVLDGIWIPSKAVIDAATQARVATPSPLVLLDRPSPLGGTLRFQVSYLILDLDGRININASGITSGTGPTSYPTGTEPDAVGLGMGYGPADIDASLLFQATPALPPTNGLTPFVSTGTSGAPIWGPLVFGGTSAVTSTSPLPNGNQRRMPPSVGSISGRYGSDAVPGLAGDDSGGYQTTSPSLYTTMVGGTNAITDLQGRGKVYMTGSAATPTLTFFHPSPSTDGVEDPYELRLDEESARSGAARVAGSADAVFTPAELERILRANDPDAPQLPQRLAAATSDLAQRSRMTITTDSWDTPGLTGTTAQTIETFVANHPPLTVASWTSGSNSSSINSVSADTAAGLRFNINRPVDSTNEVEREEYCKGLFTLAVALGAPAAQAAQWAANTLDFRDADAVMTSFRYDATPANGWQLDSPPKQVWGIERPELVIGSVTEDPPTGNLQIVLARPWRNVNPVTKEVVDPSLGTAPNNLLLGQTPAIWQLALINTRTQSQLASTDVADGLSYAPGDTKTLSPPGFTVPNGPGNYKVVLKRLVDPAAPPSAANPYAVVDELERGPGNNWRSNSTPAWTHWPNRPFISHAELALVPAGLASIGPDSSLAVTIPQILDVVYVPSKFAGTAVTIPGNALGAVGLDTLKVFQFSKWREPGKVNVNTITSGTVPGIDENDVIWTTLTGSPTMNNPFGPIPRTPTQPADPGPPGGGATPATPVKKATLQTL